MREIPSPLRPVLRDPVDEETLQRLWRRVGARRVHAWHRPSAVWRWGVLGGTGALAAAVLALALMPATPPPAADLRLADGRAFDGLAVAPDARAPATVRFADGTVIRAEAGTSLEPAVVEPGAFQAELVQGEIDVSVEPSDRRFRIDCGIALVEVVGTRFTVVREEGSVTVAVREGRVRVVDRVRSQETIVGVGARIVVRAAEHTTPAAPPSDAREPPADEQSAELAAPRSPRARTDEWRRLASRGDYSEAYEALGDRSVAERARAAGPEELLALADVARHAGHPREAVAPLEQLVERHPDDSRAPLAAYTLGVLRMDRLDEPAAAAEAFARASEMGLRGTLAEHALGRMAIARGRAGDAEGAREAANRYLQRNPRGALADDVRRWSRVDP